MKQLREVRRRCTRDNVEADESYLIHRYNINTNKNNFIIHNKCILIPEFRKRKKREQHKSKESTEFIINPKRAHGQIPVTYGIKLHMTPTNCHLAAQQEPQRKNFLERKVRKMGH